MTKKKAKSKKKVSENVAILCLLLNILILPGLGSLIGYKKEEGIWQLVLVLLGLPLALILIGIPMIIGAWIWGIVTGVEIIREAEK